jgi:hypothetical protein
MEQRKVRRWLRGQAAASVRERAVARREGARPEQAVAEALAALNALAAMGLWPGPRDLFSERQVEEVRRRWGRIQRRAKKLASR